MTLEKYCEINSWHDDQYLFRLTSTFGWDESIALCNSLIVGIENAASKAATRRLRVNDDDNDEDNTEEENIHDGYYFNDCLRGRRRDANEKSLPQWLHRAHAQLFYLDPWGNSPIHAASYAKPPADAIEALFLVGRALRRHISYGGGGPAPPWATRCKDGSTPFLVACSTGASASVLHGYLDEVEFYVERGWVRDPRLARTLVLQPDDQGTSPLMGWMNLHWGWIKRQSEQQGRSGGHHSIPRRVGGRASSQSLPDYWNLACRILLFATTSPGDLPATSALVHRCAAIAMHCPVSLLEWVVAPPLCTHTGNEWVPADLSAATPDSSGRLPMHCAMEASYISTSFDGDFVRRGADFASRLEYSAANSPAAKTEADGTRRPRAEAASYDDPKLEKNRVRIIGKLLRWHPRAAETAFSNGRAPLIQAVARGGTWHPMGYRANAPDDGDPGLLQLLGGYAPERTSERDPVTGLYPFMLAAAVPRRRENGNWHERDRDVVDTIFCLLREDPQLVAGALIGIVSRS